MRINVAHIRIQGNDVAVFEADAVNHTDRGRAALLAQLTSAFRAQGRKVDKAALAFASSGGVRFCGAPDLVRFLASGWIPNWTHTLTL